ncbi:MAG: hypothetical protein KZQ99_14475 [Candidatus Thiodiazotropha sp. (ex Dulcina madagascariensis)]|nr:hypothetical protein [Candidatus Thiodiazotropha sp. (ex Dulcina madagascariensis)]
MIVNDLPENYRQALEIVEGAGGKVSEFAKDLARDKQRLGLSDDDIIAFLINRYKVTNNEDRSSSE